VLVHHMWTFDVPPVSTATHVSPFGAAVYSHLKLPMITGLNGESISSIVSDAVEL
jgi:lauroyl/myristoyl acyltransferase